MLSFERPGSSGPPTNHLPLPCEFGVRPGRPTTLGSREGLAPSFLVSLLGLLGVHLSTAPGRRAYVSRPFAFFAKGSRTKPAMRSHWRGGTDCDGAGPGGGGVSKSVRWKDWKSDATMDGSIES